MKSERRECLLAKGIYLQPIIRASLKPDLVFPVKIQHGVHMSTLKLSKTLQHETPLWIRESEEVFFITVCCEERGRDFLAIPSIAPQLVESVSFRHQSVQWICESFVVMPDHVHGLFQFTGDQRMANVIRNWKRWTSRQLGIFWQRNWFDHRIRRTEDRSEKANYIANNPVRAGLCENANDWPYLISR